MAHAAHDDAHEEAAHAPAYVPGDDVPQHQPPVDEPRSPTWLPVVGVILLASALVWWLSTPNDAEEAAAAAAASASASASAAAAQASASANPSSMVSAVPTLTAHNAPAPPGMPPLPSGFQMAPGAAINPKFKKP
jgi:hypothetical protein